ncbi:lebercilin-like [Lethenteron reissneri]|uniref:lebercilin-like n=1 Tax=Lethenteron reissneri TaxID=7753 RepID=UPI002AB5FD47|nr:lebercilin-like [Lethenteron reissneri]
MAMAGSVSGASRAKGAWQGTPPSQSEECSPGTWSERWSGSRTPDRLSVAPSHYNVSTPIIVLPRRKKKAFTVLPNATPGRWGPPRAARVLYGGGGGGGIRDARRLERRVHSARLRASRELRDEAVALTRRLAEVRHENIALWGAQRRHQLAINAFEVPEGGLGHALDSHARESRRLREATRVAREAERGHVRAAVRVEALGRRACLDLEALAALASDDALPDEPRLRAALLDVERRLLGTQPRVQELQKSLEVNVSNFTRQFRAERHSLAETQSLQRALQVQVDCLAQQLREKDRELDIQNIYANRFLKGSSKKDDDSDQANKAVQTDSYLEREWLEQLRRERERREEEERATRELEERREREAREREENARRETERREREERARKERRERQRRERLERARLALLRVERERDLALQRQRERHEEEQQALRLIKERARQEAERRAQELAAKMAESLKVQDGPPATSQNGDALTDDGGPKQRQRPTQARRVYRFTDPVENMYRGRPAYGMGGATAATRPPGARNASGGGGTDAASNAAASRPLINRAVEEARVKAELAELILGPAGDKSSRSGLVNGGVGGCSAASRPARVEECAAHGCSRRWHRVRRDAVASDGSAMQPKLPPQDINEDPR